MAEVSLGELLKAVTVKGLPEAEYQEALRSYQERMHRAECRRCRGEPGPLPCTRASDYQAKSRRLYAGLDLDHVVTFESYLPRTAKQRTALGACQRWAGHPKGWLVLLGPPGVGKSHLALAVAETTLAAHRVVRYWNVAALLDELRALYQRDRAEAAEYPVAEAMLGYCGDYTLVLDDLGAEKSTPWALERLGYILAERWPNYPTVLTTNLDAEGLAEVYGPRVTDRVLATSNTLLMLDGVSHRSGIQW